jgi:hypothetical protein
LLFSKHFNLQSGGRSAGVKREIKTETTGSFAYNFSVLKNVPEELALPTLAQTVQDYFQTIYLLYEPKLLKSENPRVKAV